MRNLNPRRGLAAVMLLLAVIPNSSAASAGDAGQLAEEIRSLITARGYPAASLKGLASVPIDSLVHRFRTFSDFSVPDSTGLPVLLEHLVSDTLAAPAYLYIPAGYRPDRPAPLLINLHGGVSRPSFRTLTAEDWQDNDLVGLCEELGMLMLRPMGRSGLTWWDGDGMANLAWFVREVKRRYNIDDDRVFMCGFSDGASGSYHWAMLNPTPFAAFLPWSGHPAVGSLVGGIQAYLPNLRNRPLFASGGGLDQLYPTARLEPIYVEAMRAGADLAFVDYDTAHHNGGYLELELPRVRDALRNARRNPFPSRLYWETADIRYAGADWLWITELDTAADAAEWHRDYNATLSDDRLTIGFNPDQDYKGKGVRLATVVDDTTLPAGRAGLKVGDILLKLDEVKVNGIADVNRFKEGRKRGDAFSMTVKRGGKQMTLSTAFAPAGEYPAFNRGRRSGAVRATRVGNTFWVETSCVKSLTLFLSEEMIHFSQAVTVYANGAKIYHGWVQPDAKVLLERFNISGDRRALWSARLDLVL